MSLSNPNENDEEEQNETTEETGMRPPEAASRAELERVEEEAHQKAHEEAAAVHTELREEMEAMRERIEMLEDYQRDLDRLVNFVYDHVDGLNSEMPNVVPENREEETPESINLVGDDDE